MHTLEDKVSNQLSRFLPASPNISSSSPYSLSSPSDNSQARPFSSGGKSFYSFSFPGLNFAGSGSNKHQKDLKPIQSKPVRWGGKDLKQQDDYLVKYHECSTINDKEEFHKSSEDGVRNKKTGKTHDSNGDDGSGRSSGDSDVFEEAHEQQTPRSSLHDLMEESSFIPIELYEFLHSSLPNIVKGCQWRLLYSTLKHGISLRTLIRNSADLSGPCILIVGDRQGAVFGGLLECPLKPTPKRKYQGTNQSFVFTTIYGEPRLFRPTGANRYFYMCLNDLLALGGGSNFALCLDGDLLNGTSGPCETFGNLCLAHKPEFELKNVELWGFTHSSKYLT